MTHASTLFKRHVDALPPQLDDGMSAASQLVEPETGTVTLAFRQWLMPDLVRTCRAAHPRARFS
jgi:LysR family transcriptional regulator, transcription activator of glutamate synthase operon